MSPRRPGDRSGTGPTSSSGASRPGPGAERTLLGGGDRAQRRGLRRLPVGLLRPLGLRVDRHDLAQPVEPAPEALLRDPAQVVAGRHHVLGIDAHVPVGRGRPDRLRDEHLLERLLAHVVADLLAALGPDRADDRLDVPEDERDRRLVRDQQHRARARLDDRVLPVDLLHDEVLVRVEPERDRRHGPREDPDAEPRGRDLERGEPAAPEPLHQDRGEHAEGEAHRQREARGHEVVELRPPVEEEDDEVPATPAPNATPTTTAAGSSPRGPRRSHRPARNASHPRPATPRADRYQELARELPVLKRKSTSPFRLLTMLEMPNAEVCPCWSCQKRGVAARTLLCQAYGIRSSGEMTTGHGRMTRLALAHPTAATKAVGATKMIDSYRLWVRSTAPSTRSVRRPSEGARR